MDDLSGLSASTRAELLAPLIPALAGRKADPTMRKVDGGLDAAAVPFIPGGWTAAANAAGIGTASPALNGWDQFWADQNGYRQQQIDRRTDAGVVPSEGMFDWSGLQYDLNQPYRDRLQREAAEKTPFDPLQAITDEHDKRLAEVAKKTVPSWIAAARADQAAKTPAPAASVGAAAYDRLSDYQPLLNLMTGVTPDKIYDPNAKVAQLSDTGALPIASSYAPDTRPAVMPPLPPLPPLPRVRPDVPNGMGGGIDIADAQNLPGQVEGGINKVTAKLEEPSVWDKVVEGGGKVLEHTTLGGVVKTLFPDIWEAGGQLMKGKGGSGSATMPTDDSPSWFQQITDPMYSPSTEQPLRSMASEISSDRRRTVPATTTPPPAGGGGGTTTSPPGTISPDIYDRWGAAVFPNLPPYNPGVDPEWLYFRKKYADGGIVGYADGGPVAPTAGMDPRVSIIADAEDAIEGDSPDPQGALEKFVKTFGQEALTSLVEQVRGGMKMRQRGRMVKGPGGPKDDAVPAMTDDGQPVALSNGEFVMPVEAVDGAGGPEKMQQMSDMLQQQAGGQ